MNETEKLIPFLVCQDIAAEHDFLVESLGFSSGGIHRAPDGQAVHGEVRIPDFVIWLHRVDDEFRLASPRSLPAASSGLFVFVRDVDAHYERARSRGAQPESEPKDMSYGQREYGLKDPEGTSVVVRHSACLAIASGDSTLLKRDNMRRDIFIQKLDYFNLVHGVTLRAISAFGDHDLEFRPQPTTRTVKELAFHIYAQEKSLAEAMQQGQFTAELADCSNPESETVANELLALKTTKNVLMYAAGCHETAERILRALKEEDLTGQVASPFGTFPAWKYFDFVYDEHWHHRGQLYTYLRLLGKEPPMLYDY